MHYPVKHQHATHPRARQHPEMTCFQDACCPCRQWSFPLPLPLPLLGIFRAKQLPLSGGSFPWSNELEHACLAEFIGAAPYSEVLFHPTCQNWKWIMTYCKYRFGATENNRLASYPNATLCCAVRTLPLHPAPAVSQYTQKCVRVCDLQAFHRVSMNQAVPKHAMTWARDECMQAVFYHKASKTLLVTDAVVYISPDPPEVMVAVCSPRGRCCKNAHTRRNLRLRKLTPLLHVAAFHYLFSCNKRASVMFHSCSLRGCGSQRTLGALGCRASCL